jgi:hypothetical protein
MTTSEDATIEREFPELATALRADVAVPTPAFSESLGARVREDFPRERRWRPPRARTIGLAGAAASLLVAVGLALLLQGGEEKSHRALKLGRDMSAPSVAEPELKSGTPLGVSPGRAIERSAALTLAAPGDELDSVADRIVAVTDRYRGFVARSSVTSGNDAASGGSFDLRIPADSLRPAIRDLSALGHVRSRTQSGEDVTRGLAIIADRLRATRAERRSLLRRLEQASSNAQIEAIRRRLDLVTGEIRGRRAELRDRRQQVAYAKVDVSLVKDGGGNNGAGALGGTGDALHDALGTLAGALNLALRALGVMLPLALLAGLAWLTGRTLLRRRREAALS